MLLRALKGASLPRRNAFITKTLLAMRLTSILLLATGLHLSARTLAQQINLSEQHVSLDKVFKKITDQTGYLFVYRDEWLKQTKSVSISVHSADLKEVLDLCFTDQPFTYVIIDKMVVLKEKPARLAMDAPDQDGIDVRGRVADSTGTPLTGASIRIKGTTKGTQADVRGEFALKNIPEGTVLVVSYTGYVSKEIPVSAKGNSYHYTVLQRSQDELDVTVIQAYGTTSRRFNVGSISTVDAATIEKQPVTNVMLALQGQIPGLAVTSTSGVPGNTVLLQVRGQNTILANNPPYGLRPYDQPLIIIDGVPFAPQNNNLSSFGNLGTDASTGGGISQFGGVSPFASINPADIESITVLKDADATSIYGTQGSNGVILITTKKGKPGKTTFGLTATTGFNSTARPVKMANTQQYLQLRNEAFAQDSITPSLTPYSPGYAPDLLVFDQDKYTNWEKTIYGKTTNNTDVHASVSGGTTNNTFILSGGYTRSDFNYPGNFSDQRLTLHSMIHHGSTDNRLTMDFGVDVGYDQNHSAGYAGNKDVLLPPNMPDLKNPDGSLVWTYKGVDVSQSQFYAYLLQPDNLQNYNINNTLHLSYKIISGLSIGVTAGYNRNTTSETTELPAASQSPVYVYRSATFAQNNYQTVNIEPQVDYNVTIGKGTLSALVGATYKKNTNYQQQVTGTGYSSDLFLGSIEGATQLEATDQTLLYKYDAGFARLKYIYNQEFILSVGGRRDGSSNFGPGRQFGSFGSAGAGWIFTQEKPVTKALPLLSYGKLYGSYGTSGSDGIAPYSFQPFYQPNNNVPAVQGVQPSVPQNLYNPNYGWATKKSLNIALDLGFFHDRLLFNASFYRDREGDQLGGYPEPIQTGFGQVFENLPANVQNQGWEFSFTSTNVKGRDFTWKTNFNIAFNRNKLLSFPNLAGSSYASLYQIGKPTSIVFGYRYKDINPTTGQFEYLNAKNQLTSSPAYGLVADGGDQVPIADREVKYAGGFGNTFTYKRVSLYVFFQFSSQTAPNWMYTLYGSYTPGNENINVPTAVLGHYWTGPGDTHATLQRLVTSYSSRYAMSASAFTQSSGAYSNDTYARLKTLSLSYALPDNLLKSAHIHDLRIYCNAQNLLTFTNYKVSDPETFSDYTTFPVQRIVAFGLNCNF